VIILLLALVCEKLKSMNTLVVETLSPLEYDSTRVPLSVSVSTTREIVDSDGPPDKHPARLEVRNKNKTHANFLWPT
jgi:hypothetical protein